MRKNVFYITAFGLLMGFLIFFNMAYEELTSYSELTNRHNTVYSIYKNLSKQTNDAAILTRELVKVGYAKEGSLFFADSQSIARELNLLKSTVRDSINIRIAKVLDTSIKSEISWLLKSNLPDSIIHHQSPGHIAAFQHINFLINQGIERTYILTEYRKKELNREISKIRIWMALFIILSGILLIYTTFHLFRQQSKRKSKERELEIVLNRISDGVVSVDNEWRYTFLNDAALANHPESKKDTIGKTIWAVHPQMEGTIFWDKYHEAMETRKVVDIEDYYAPMNIWFLVRVYPSVDGLTIFYKDITQAKKMKEELALTLKAVTDYKFALDESSIVAITDQKGIITYVNDNFCKISKYTSGELIGRDHRIINSGYHSKAFIRNLWLTISNGKIWKGELKNKAKDGTVYWVDTTIVPFLNDHGKPYQYAAIRADITKRKQAEEEIKLLNESLEKRVVERTRELNIVNKELDFQNKEMEKKAAALAISENELRKSERQVQLMVSNIKDYAIFMLDVHGYVVTWNSGAQLIKGYTKEEIIGKSIRVFYTQEELDNKEPQRNLELALQNGHFETQGVRVRKDGSYFYADIVFTALFDANGQHYGYAKVTRDITERVKAEKQLKEFEHFFNNNNDLCGIANTAGLFETINSNFTRALGYSEKEFCEIPFIDLVHPDDVAPTTREYEKLKAGSLVINFVNRYIKKDGTCLFLDWNATLNPITGKLYCVARDITDRKAAEDEIIKANKRFISIFNFSPVAISITSLPEGHFIQVNDAFCETTGYKMEELIGKRSVDINMIGTEAGEKLIKQILSDGGEGKDIEGTLTKPNGEMLEILYRAEKIELDGQECFVAALIDITDRKKAEIEIHAANKELESFSYSVSHDLRAPLRAIHGYTKMLKAGYEPKVDSEGNRLMNNIVENAKKMGQLIDDLLNFSRIGRHDVIKKNIPMHELVENICTEFKKEHTEHSIEFDIKRLLPARADNTAIKQVWFNLISNSIKYSRKKEKTIIEIGSEIKGSEIVYHIKDNGAGFDMRYADKLFGVFQRLHSEEEFEGTGVGLAIVQRIIFKHGGRVWAEGRVNEGAIFYFSLNKT